MKVPWSEEPEVYDNTPPWEREAENEFAAYDPPDIGLVLPVSGGEVATHGYIQGQKVTGNQNVFIGYQAGPAVKDITPGGRSVKIAQACPQCGNILYEMRNCYICFACGSTCAIEEG